MRRIIREQYSPLEKDKHLNNGLDNLQILIRRVIGRNCFNEKTYSNELIDYSYHGLHSNHKHVWKSDPFLIFDAQIRKLAKIIDGDFCRSSSKKVLGTEDSRINPIKPRQNTTEGME